MQPEETFYRFWHFLQCSHFAANEIYKVSFGLQSGFSKLFFQVIPDLFIRIQLRGIAWQQV
ncbi:hypothetical protein MJO57_25505 [Endozoicomonas sp. SCSIO W0465]|nr:hypothetical protein [Endozoicomonas sp. SCSIO W0465]USE35419.1 hypothetical protein MJO57_25505 [Endozoicomonas sp. SCSIO W0465]